MKALFVSNDPTIFDPHSAVHTRMRAYAEAIGELHIISRGNETRDTADGPLFLHSVKPLPTVLGRLLFMRTLASHARRLVRELDIEVVSAQDPFEHGAAAQHAVHGTKAKLHVQVHTDFLSPYFAQESHKNKVRVRMADAVLPKADGVRVVSERIKRSLRERYKEHIPEPVVIPIAVETQELHATDEPLNAPFPFVIIAVGRLEKEKRFADVIRAVSELVKERYPVTLAIVGDGSEKVSLVSLAEELGISKHVLFLGWRTDVQALFVQAHAFVQTSSYEGYGRTFVEAALANLPMVVTDTGIIGDVFTNNESALVCPVGDVSCFARSLANLIEEHGLRIRLGENATRAAHEHIASMQNMPQRIADDLAATIARTS